MESKSSSSRSLFWLAAIVLLVGAAVLLWMSRGTISPSGIISGPSDEPSVASRAGVTGVTVDGETGAKLAGVTVGCGDDDVVTGDDGAFDCGDQPVGAAITGNKEGYFDAEPASAESDGASLTLVLTQKAFVSGKTVASGEPVGGAVLSVLRLGDGDPDVEKLPSISGADGRFRLEVRPGRLRVLAEATGYALGESREIKVLGGTERRDLTIDLTPRGALSVLVVDPGGNPVSGALVETLGMASWQSHSETTGGDGRVLFESIPEGLARVRVTSSHFSVTDSEDAKVVRDERATLTVTMVPLQGIVGVVVDESGKPVSKASVVLRPTAAPTATNTAQSNARGEFRFESLDSGQVELTATHTAYSPSTTVRAQTGTREVVRLELHAGGRISGTIIDPDGNPIDERFNFGVERFTPDEGTLAGVSESLPGSGHFGPQVMANPPDFTTGTMVPGLYDLYAETRSYGPGRVSAVRVNSGRTTEGVVIRLTAGVTVTGRVVHAETGDGIADASVFYTALSVPRTPRSAKSDENGNFIISGITPGRRSISAMKKGFVRRILAGLELQAGDTEDVLIELTPTDERGRQTEFFGIGAVLRSTESGSVMVQSLLDNGPAREAGLKEGAEILTVDGEETSKLGLGRTVELIRGDEGASVVLQIREPGSAIPTEITIERGKVRYKNNR